MASLLVQLNQYTTDDPDDEDDEDEDNDCLVAFASRRRADLSTLECE
jgi:hypothetical protein